MVVGEIAEPVDLLVIGAGPGGYVAALRAAELGREVVEQRVRVGVPLLQPECPSDLGEQHQAVGSLGDVRRRPASRRTS